MASLPDITDRSSVEQMVNSFYERVNADDLLSPIFNDFAGINWDSHLPRMYDFWDSILFGTAKYQGRPFPKHIPLPIDARHFERWVGLFEQNIDLQFSGPNAEEAKNRARSIARIFQSKLRFVRG